jgi:hypothetical protein
MAFRAAANAPVVGQIQVVFSLLPVEDTKPSKINVERIDGHRPIGYTNIKQKGITQWQI